MTEPSPAAFNSVNTKWTVTLVVLGAATLLLYRLGVHSKGVADIVWFLELAGVQIAIYVVVVWVSLRLSLIHI